MKYRIRPHPRVRHDLEAIRTMLAGFSGDRIAGEIVDRIIDRASKLADLPYIGGKRDEVAPGVRIVCDKKAVIAYRIEEDARRVRIVAITYGGADWQARVRERG